MEKAGRFLGSRRCSTSAATCPTSPRRSTASTPGSPHRRNGRTSRWRRSLRPGRSSTAGSAAGSAAPRSSTSSSSTAPSRWQRSLHSRTQCGRPACRRSEWSLPLFIRRSGSASRWRAASPCCSSTSAGRTLPFALMCCAAITEALADALYAGAILDQTYVRGGLTELLWVASIGLIVWAAIVQIASSRRPHAMVRCAEGVPPGHAGRDPRRGHRHRARRGSLP